MAWAGIKSGPRARWRQPCCSPPSLPCRLRTTLLPPRCIWPSALFLPFCRRDTMKESSERKINTVSPPHTHTPTHPPPPPPPPGRHPGGGVCRRCLGPCGAGHLLAHAREVRPPPCLPHLPAQPAQCLPPCLPSLFSACLVTHAGRPRWRGSGTRHGAPRCAAVSVP